jgi:hypothetical protein
MAKLKLTPDPTFKAKVGIPVPGQDSADVEFTFKHRTRDETMAWLKEVTQMTDTDTLMGLAVGWDLDDEFTRENVERLCTNYGGSGAAVLNKYLAELRGERTKN